MKVGSIVIVMENLGDAHYLEVGNVREIADDEVYVEREQGLIWLPANILREVAHPDIQTVYHTYRKARTALDHILSKELFGEVSG